MQTQLLQPSLREQDQGLFFSTPELSQRLDFLRHLTENSDFIPLMKGGEGTGKTFMANRLQALAGENWILCRIEATPALHPNKLLAQCARCFGIRNSQGRLLEELIHGLDDLRLAGRLAVILVDDAHLLPPETLVFLFGLHGQTGGDFPLVRIVLFADPQIDDVLAAPRFESVDLDKLHTLQIPRLKAQQIPNFVKYTLGETGEAATAPLPMDEVIRLYRQSGGVPGRLVELIGTEVFGTGAVKAGPRRPLPVKLTAGLLGMGLLVSLVLVYQDEINRLVDPRGTPDRTGPLRAPDAPSAAPTGKGRQENSPDAGRPDAARIRPLNPSPAKAPQPKATAKPSPTIQGSPAEAPLAVSVQADSQPGLQTPKPAQPAEPVVQPAPVSAVRPATPAPVQGASAQGKVVKKPAATVAPPVRAAAQPVPVASARTAPRPEEPPPAPADKGWRREAWLLAQNPEAYTIQLIGVRDEATLGRFIERHGLQDKAVYYASGGKDKQPWFSLLYGVYPDRKAAEAGRRGLPAELRKKDVWYRRLDAVQNEIRDIAR